MWRIQLLHCTVVGVLLGVVPLTLHRKFDGSPLPLYRFDRLWIVSSCLVAVYLAERVRYDWKQLQFFRSLDHEISTVEFRIRSARGRLHRQSLMAALALCFFLMIVFLEGSVLHNQPLMLFVALTYLSKSTVQAWYDLRDTERSSLHSAV
jgi:hypothetical protein